MSLGLFSIAKINNIWYGIYFEKNSPLVNEKRDSNWEYLKDRVFDDTMEDVRSIKFVDNLILLSLLDATRDDSLVVKEIIKDFRKLGSRVTSIYYAGEFIKDYKSFFENSENIDPFQKQLLKSTIEVSFKDYKEEANQNNQFENAYTNKDVVVTRLINKNVLGCPFGYINFSFNPEITLERRQHHIRYGVFREFFVMKLTSKTNNFASISGFETPFFAGVKYEPEGASMSSYDWFLLKELYAYRFKENFKNYLYEYYPWQYASNFINKENTIMIAIGIVFIIGVLIFLLAFRILNKRHYKYSYFVYYFPIFITYYTLHQLYFLFNFISVGEHDFSFNYLIKSLIIISLFTLPISFFLWLLEKLLIKNRMSFRKQFILKILSTLFSIIFTLFLGSVFSQFQTTPSAWSFPFRVFLQFLKQNLVRTFSWENPFLIFLLILVIARALVIVLNYFSQSLVNAKNVELSQLKEAKAQAETNLLQSQINPHFLYNSLNSIASLALTDGVKTQKMAYSLSDLFKYSINRKGKKMSTVLEEVAMVETYLEIEKIRFGERLQYELQIEPQLNDFQIPLFLIQPLVENAVKHGVSQNEQGGKIVMKIEKEANGIVISVRDNGPSFPKGLISGHGLQTVYDLLRLSYGDKASLNWTNTPEKMIVVVIPKTV